MESLVWEINVLEAALLSNPGTGDRVESGDREHGHLQEADLDQMVVSLDNISCSLYPYDTELHDSSRSSRDNLGIVSRGQNVSLPSHNAGSNTQSPLGGGYTRTIQPGPTSPRPNLGGEPIGA